MTQVVLPFPGLLHRYVQLTGQASADRLLEAEAVTADELASEFEESVAAHLGLPAITDPFYPADPNRDGHKSEKARNRTFGWSMGIKAAEPAVAVPDASELSFRYVAREVNPTRTEHRPVFESEVARGKQMQIDLILAHVPSGRPIVAELKIRDDKDPYTALIQALAGASQLVSRSQRDRLVCHLGGLAGVDAEPLVDVYVLLAGFPPTGRHRFDQLACAVRLAAQLEGHPQVKLHLGRIRVLTLSRAPAGSVVASVKLPQRAGASAGR